MKNVFKCSINISAKTRVLIVPNIISLNGQLGCTKEEHSREAQSNNMIFLTNIHGDNLKDEKFRYNKILFYLFVEIRDI